VQDLELILGAIGVLFREDLQDGRVIDDLQIVNPLRG